VYRNLPKAVYHANSQRTLLMLSNWDIEYHPNVAMIKTKETKERTSREENLIFANQFIVFYPVTVGPLCKRDFQHPLRLGEFRITNHPTVGRPSGRHGGLKATLQVKAFSQMSLKTAPAD